jgi:nucleotide-binding universal stress UspA family protein
VFKTILVPLDLTDKHEAALAVAAQLAQESCGAVTLFHVVEVIPGLSHEEEKGFYGRLEQTAKSHLQKHAATLLAQAVRCHTKVVLGQRALETVAEARKIQADLIILTAPPFAPQNPTAALSSMSWKIGLMAPCSVLLVK